MDHFRNSATKIKIIIFFLSFISLYAEPQALFIKQIDLPAEFTETVLSLSTTTWPNSTYYRETIDFGKVFPALEEGIIIEVPIPSFVTEIRAKLFEIFKDHLQETTAEEYDNCIITIYHCGDGIAPHIDRNLEWAMKSPNRKYYFGDSVIGLIIEPDLEQSLYFEHPLEGRFYLKEHPGTAYLFQDALRHEWRHGLFPVAQRRISMTFRKVVFKP